MKQKIAASLWIMFAVLLACVVALVRSPASKPFFVPQGSLYQLFNSDSLLGWESRMVPIGPTEVLSKQVERVLLFDDVFYQVYRRGGVEVFVFVAYWRPGKADPWQIALHTPDSCWVMNGAAMTYRDDKILFTSGDESLWPANFRRFKWTGGPEVEVAFWHLYGGAPSGFPVTGDRGLIRARWDEMRLAFTNTCWGTVQREQVFIRISTTSSLVELSRSDLWPHLMDKLRKCGIFSRNELSYVE